MCEISSGETLFSLTDLQLQEQPSLTMPALTTTVSNNLCVSVTVFLSVLGLGGAPDEPHAVNVAACISEGSGVGKVKEPPALQNNEISPLIPLTDSELHKIREDAAVTIVFKMQVTQHIEVQWETVFWGRTLYIQVPNAILPEGPKEGFVSLLEYAEEKLKCTHVVVCFKKERFDRACLIRTFMYLGFVMLAPGHELAPSTSDYLYMAYIID